LKFGWFMVSFLASTCECDLAQDKYVTYSRCTSRRLFCLFLSLCPRQVGVVKVALLGKGKQSRAFPRNLVQPSLHLLWACSVGWL